jgi:acyl-coenzyme A thioesterase PaaI-like protein
VSIPFDDGRCFACGPENPIGLHLEFAPDGEEVRASVALDSVFQGWRGIAHGGIVMALLDEAMAHAAGFAGHRGMTASANVRFRKPVPIDETIEIIGRVAWQRRNIVGVEACVRSVDGAILAESDGKFVSMGAVNAVNDRRNTEWQK